MGEAPRPLSMEEEQLPVELGESEEREPTHMQGFHMPDNDPDEIVDLAEAKERQMRCQAASADTVATPNSVATPEGTKERLNGDASCVKTASRRSRASFSARLGAAEARDVVNGHKVGEPAMPASKAHSEVIEIAG